jgi:hypothetical protein
VGVEFYFGGDIEVILVDLGMSGEKEEQYSLLSRLTILIYRGAEVR